MKFKIEYTGITLDKVLTYDFEDLSFETQPITNIVSYDLVLNNLNLTVADDNIVTQLWGFCGSFNWINGDYRVPESKRGELKVIDSLEPGFSYKLTNEDCPVYLNIQTNWICIGNPNQIGNSVEFINNCIAVIDERNEFISLWLKPIQLLRK